MGLFNYLNYHTLYSCTGTVNRDLKHDCCFRYITKENPQMVMSNNYHILFHKTPQLIKDNNHNNYCLLDAESIIRYLNMLKAYYPFSFKLSEDEYEIEDCEDNEELEDEPEYGNGKYPVWVLDLHIEGNLMYHKFILTQIRPLYEFPFNVALLDARKMRTVPEFNKYTTLNLYSLVISIIGRWRSTDALDDQCFISLGGNSFPKFKSLRKYCENLKNNEAVNNDVLDLGYRQARIHKIHEYLSLPGDLYEKARKFDTEFIDQNINVCTEEFWRSEDHFAKRCEIYSEVLPYLINQ